MNRCLKEESGYSLVEVMAAIMIMAIAIIPMVSMFDAGLRAIVLGGNYDKARAIAGEELEEIKALPFRIDNPAGVTDSAVEFYPPANSPSPPPGGSTPCSPPIDAAFTCEVQTTYLNPSTLSPDSGARAVMEVEVTVEWDGGSNSYTTTGLMTKETR